VSTGIKVPPKPGKPPTVHLGTGKRKATRTLKGGLGSLKEKASSTRTKWAEGRKASGEKQRKTREEAKKILAPVKEKVEEEKKLAGEVMKPVHSAIRTVRANLDPSNGKTRPYVTSFLLSSIVSWIVSPQILTAAYERIHFGTSTTGWGLLNGPGRWFRDTVGMAYESGQMGSLIWSAIMGLLPMIILTLRNIAAQRAAESVYQGRMSGFSIKWLNRLAYSALPVFFTGVSYPTEVTSIFGSPWTFQMWQFWVAGLFCTAYYFTTWVLDRIERLNRERMVLPEEEREKLKVMGPGIFHVLLMVPLASIVTGILLYAPGAAW
jgi:hypothetical protein